MILTAKPRYWNWDHPHPTWVVFWRFSSLTSLHFRTRNAWIQIKLGTICIYHASRNQSFWYFCRIFSCLDKVSSIALWYRRLCHWLFAEWWHDWQFMKPSNFFWKFGRFRWLGASFAIFAMFPHSRFFIVLFCIQMMLLHLSETQFVLCLYSILGR